MGYKIRNFESRQDPNNANQINHTMSRRYSSPYKPGNYSHNTTSNNIYYVNLELSNGLVSSRYLTYRPSLDHPPRSSCNVFRETEMIILATTGRSN